MLLTVLLLVSPVILIRANKNNDDEVMSLPGWEGPLPSKHYSGYLDTAQGHHMHYWLVESEGSPDTDPLVLWVQGGPGGSSLLGMFTEMGPFSAIPGVNTTLIRNPGSWASFANLLFWESPCGVGFSYCDGGCPSWNDTTTAEENAQFLCSFYEKYPQYVGRELYLTGESYAGVYIPTLAMQISAKSPSCTANINLKGFAIGNGCTGTQVGTCSPERGLNTYKQIASQGLISLHTQSIVNTECADSLGFTDPSNACINALLNASMEAGNFNNYNVQDTCETGSANQFAHMLCGFTNVSAFCKAAGVEEEVALGNQPEDYNCGQETALTSYLNRADVMQAIHVKDDKWITHAINYTRSYPDLVHNFPSLVAKYQVLIYSGDFDAQIPHYGTEEWTSGLQLPVAQQWRPWVAVDTGDSNPPVAGYVTEYAVSPSRFAYVTIKGAGHMVPTYKPIEAKVMMQRFINGSQF
eukprot:m.343051 g.343051  ORF g.343051 m.343051 type:complete len:467 (+) comp22257_c0_seq1:52-1452(+)